MRLIKYTFLFFLALNAQKSLAQGTNPEDPYESINRRIFTFNRGLDKVVLKPIAKIYNFLVPTRGRAIINNFYTNINMIPTFINDLLQADFTHASQDAHRLVLNSTIGIGGIFDLATMNGFPLRSNDLGITFAVWGDKKSPYVVLPFLGPSTIRDGMGMLFDYTFFTPYPYIPYVPLYTLLAVRYVDLRAQMFDTDRLIEESLDKYAFVRDAYLQHRNYLIQGEKSEEDGSMYVDEAAAPTEANPLPKPVPTSAFPLTTS
ncbi:MAG: MlaA family lipoprotein [Gammaproteobacteria bacterium]